MEQAIAFSNRHFVDACVPVRHQAVLCEFPVLVTIGTEPLTIIIAIFVGVAYSDAVAGESPGSPDRRYSCSLFHLRAQMQASSRLVANSTRFRQRVSNVSQSNLGGVTAVPAVFKCQTDLFDSSFAGERGEEDVTC